MYRYGRLPPSQSIGTGINGADSVNTGTAARWIVGISAVLSLGFIIGTMIVSINTNTQVGSLLPNFPQFIGSCGIDRHLLAYTIRIQAAIANYLIPPPCQINNGDESLYTDKRAQYSKCLLHDSTTGLVVPSYYATITSAVAARNFDSVELAPGATVKLTNPLAGLAYQMIGEDPQMFTLPVPPTFRSAEQASEYVENAWMALLRDLPFDQYDTGNTTAAISELNGLTDFAGPLPVNSSSLFRGWSPGCVVGPYLSQFFYQPINYGVNPIDLRIMTPATPGLDFMTNMTTWLNVQNGQTPLETATFGSTPRYMINGRDLAQWVHHDMLSEAYHFALMYLLDSGAPLNPTNPYLTSTNQIGFATWGPPHFATLLQELGAKALQVAWYQKWFVGRRMRPEVFAARVDRQKKSVFNFSVNSQALNSVAAMRLNATYGSYLLPQAFPEGSPTHPTYPSGHATVAGACVTMLKALFDGSYVIPSPLMPSADGSTVVAYTGTNLTVEGELNKLANNVALGRNIAGVHSRSDSNNSLLLGEQIAIGIMRDYKNTFPEPNFHSWRFNDFNGNLVIV